MRTFALVFALLLPVGTVGAIELGAYKTGTEITQEQLDKFVVGKSKKADVTAEVGHPNRREQLGDNQVWYYDFTKIRHIGKNVSEATFFEFDKAGLLVDKGKTGSNAKTGNPLLDAGK